MAVGPRFLMDSMRGALPPCAPWPPRSPLPWVWAMRGGFPFPHAVGGPGKGNGKRHYRDAIAYPVDVFAIRPPRTSSASVVVSVDARMRHARRISS